MARKFVSLEEVEIWLENNFKCTFSEEDESLIKYYTANEEFNRKIREKRNLSVEYAKIDKCLDKNLSLNKLPEDIIVYRGISKENYKKMIKMAKENSNKHSLLKPVLFDIGYLSTSMLEHRTLRKEIILEIHVPKETPAIYIGNCSVSPEQAELLLPKCTTMEVIKKKKNKIEVVIV